MNIYYVPLVISILADFTQKVQSKAKIMDMYMAMRQSSYGFKFVVYWVNTKQHASLTPLRHISLAQKD